MGKKLKRRGGLTMVEMLIATVLLTFLSMMVVTGVNMAMVEYQTIVAESETNLLLSTITNAVTNELRYARGIDPTNGRYNNMPELFTGGGTPSEDEERQAGQIYLGDVSLIPAGAYGKDGAYQVEQLKILYNSGGYDVTVKVSERNGRSSAETSFYVRCLNAP